MSNLIRWQPFDELMTMRRDMDRLFDQAFHSPMMTVDRQSTPLVDMYQTEKELVVKMPLPGVKPDDIDIKITGDQLSISGETKEESHTEEANYHLREQRYGAFSRSLALPVQVQADKAQAEMKDGVLTLTLPKAAEVLPKSIKIKAK